MAGPRPGCLRWVRRIIPILERSRRMKDKLIMKILLAGFIMGIVSALSGASLVFEQTEIIQHAELDDAKAEAVYRFTNTGDAPVTLKDPKSSCGCTVPKLEKHEYQP